MVNLCLLLIFYAGIRFFKKLCFFVGTVRVFVFEFTQMLLSLLLGYFIGAVPFGVLISKAKGICILEQGSGNPGATNVVRVLGKWGYAVFVLDFIKGILAVIVGRNYGCPYWGLLGAMLGHCFSFWIHFRGGKGVATLMGGLFIIMPYSLLSGCLVWWVVFKLLRYVSVASICFSLSLLPLHCLYYGLDASRKHALPLLFLSVFIIFCHRSNLIRLWQGKENRFK